VKLVDLNAWFLRYEERKVTITVTDGDPSTWHERGCPTKEVEVDREYYVRVKSLAEAQGIQFKCPHCVETSGHWVCVSFADRGVPAHLGSHGHNDEPTRWAASGTGLADLTLQPSIDISHACGWHGWVTNGAAQ
jgi:hypothetical protein